MDKINNFQPAEDLKNSEGKNIFTEEEFLKRQNNIFGISEKIGDKIFNNLENPSELNIKEILNNNRAKDLFLEKINNSDILEILIFIDNFDKNLVLEIKKGNISNIENKKILSFLKKIEDTTNNYFIKIFVNHIKMGLNIEDGKYGQDFLDGWIKKENIAKISDEKLYNLKKYNKLGVENHVFTKIMKIAKDGYGVFDRYERGYLSYFNGNLNDDNINFINFEKEGIGKDLSPFLDGKKIGQIYQRLLEPQFIGHLKNKFGIDFLKISIRGQIYLFNFLANSSDKKIFLFKNILNKNPEIKYQILESFLAASEEPKFAEITLKIADTEKISQENKKDIFEKYSEINNFINGELEEISENLKINKDEKNEIKKDLIKKTNDLLENLSEEIDLGEDFDIEDFKNEIKDFNLRVLQSGNFFKNIDKNFTLKDLEKIGIETKIIENYSELDNEKKEEIVSDIMKLYNENYSKKSEEKFLKEVEKNLRIDLEKESKIYLFRSGGEPILSSYLIRQEDGSLYWGGLNGDTQIQQYQFGMKVAEKIMEFEGKENDIYATITHEINGEKNPRSKILSRIYKNKFSLEKFGEGEMKDKNGEIISKYYKLFRPKDNHEIDCKNKLTV